VIFFDRDTAEYIYSIDSALIEGVNNGVATGLF